jgi:chromosomal replication initiation ATPase DnaA
MSENAWNAVLERLRASIDPNEFRRWFLGTTQASDSGDQITVWVTHASEGRHITTRYLELITRELASMKRTNVAIRFVATGYDDDDDQ